MIENMLFRKIEAWVLVAVLLAGALVTIMFGWAVHYKASGGERGGKVGDLLLAVAKIPEPLMQLALSEKSVIQPQIIDFDKFYGLQRYDSDFDDLGTLLVSSFSSDKGITTAYLFDLARQERIFEWTPPFDEIIADSSFYDERNQKKNYRTQHPLIMDDGDLLFTSGEGPLVRIDACGRLRWKIDRHFHHSIELASNGNIFVPIVMPSSSGSVSPIRDDGVAEISPDGKIVNETSVTSILERHGYIGLLYGVDPYQIDRIHLNDIEPILETDAYVRRGDLALSIRNLSTVLLYRPSTDDIIWLKTGPWLFQHDVDYQGNGVFTIFGNDNLRGETDQKSLRGFSTIWAYDQKDGSAREYLKLDDVDIFTASQGLHRVLPNGDIFVEDQNSHVLHRVNGSRLRWSYVSAIGDGKIGALHWSRYLRSDEKKFDWIGQADCPQ